MDKFVYSYIKFTRLHNDKFCLKKIILPWDIHYNLRYKIVKVIPQCASGPLVIGHFNSLSIKSKQNISIFGGFYFFLKQSKKLPIHDLIMLLLWMYGK